MPKHNLNEIVNKQKDLEKKLNSANGTAIAALVIGSISLVIVLCTLAVS